VAGEIGTALLGSLPVRLCASGLFRNMEAGPRCFSKRFSPAPVTIPHRGHLSRRVKRDLAGELSAYEFIYSPNSMLTCDNNDWRLLEKGGTAV